MFYEWREYKLRLDAFRIVALEKALNGKSPLSIFANASEQNIPQLSDLLLAFHASLQPYHKGLKLEDAYRIYDEFIGEGHTLVEFIPVIVEIYRVSGLIPKEVKEEEVKN